MLSIYRACNSTVGFLNYEFNNKLLGSVILCNLNLTIYIYINTWFQVFVCFIVSIEY